MKFKEPLWPSLRAMTEKIRLEHDDSTDFILPTMKMVEACRADDYDFFQPFIDAGLLTVAQMHHAAAGYHLGKTKSGRPIFWMIDGKPDPLDAHISQDTWISTLLKAREPFLQYWEPSYCLFGLHLAFTSERQALPVAIVDSEQSAVILSELFPMSVWMAYTSIEHLDLRLFAPLEGRNVTFYPRTDSTSSNFLFFDNLAAEVRRHCRIHITVNPILEDVASYEQKERCIDLADFLLESQVT